MNFYQIFITKSNHIIYSYVTIKYCIEIDEKEHTIFPGKKEHKKKKIKKEHKKKNIKKTK